jgi:hypothetical protein
MVMVMSTTGQRIPMGRLIDKGSVPETDPRYQSGWNFLAGKNLNPMPAKDDAQEISQSEEPTAKDQEKPE